MSISRAPSDTALHAGGADFGRQIVCVAVSIVGTGNSIEGGHPTEAPPVGVRRSTTYFPELESLRGIAILLVFFFHLAGVIEPSGAQPGTVVSPLRAFLRAGDTGVSLFFVLSGFLLALPFLIEAGGGRRVVRRDYYTRRALRILPLYYSAVLVSAVLCARSAGDILRALPYIAFLNAAGLATVLPPYSFVWWSLATEVQYYALLPFLPLLCRTRRGRWVGCAVLLTYAVALWAFLTERLYGPTIAGHLLLALSIFGRAPLFLCGILAGWIYLKQGERIRTALARSAWLRYGGADLVLLALLTGLGFVLQWVVFHGHWAVEGHPGHICHLLEGVLWAAVLLLVLLAPLRSKPLCSNRLLSTLGILSYSMYLWHVPLMWLGAAWLHALYPAAFVPGSWSLAGTVIMMTVLTIALSAVTYRAIERPFLARKARIDR